MCPVLVKFPPCLDHRQGQEARDSEVPARGRKLLETAQTAGLNQYCYMSNNLTKYSDNNQFSVY